MSIYLFRIHADYVGVSDFLRYVDVSKLYSHLGPDLWKSLPGFHALTGYDFNPSFFRKGKKTSNDVAKIKGIPGSFCKAWGLSWGYRRRYCRTNRRICMSNVQR